MAKKDEQKNDQAAAESSRREAAADGGDLGQVEVQANMNEATDQGFLGEEADPTPNENYTVEGVVAAKPTPETDEKAAAAADARTSELGADRVADEK